MCEGFAIRISHFLHFTRFLTRFLTRFFWDRRSSLRENFHAEQFMQSSGERSCRRSLASRRSMIRPTADARGRPACCWVAACDLRSSSHQATKVPANDIETSFLSVGRPSRQQQPVLLRTTIPWRRAIMRVRSATTEAVRYITVRAPARNLRVSTQRRDRRVSHFDRTCELSFCYKYLQAMLEGQPPTLARRSTGPRAPPPPAPVCCAARS